MKTCSTLLKNLKSYSVVPAALFALSNLAFADTEFAAVQEFSNHFIQTIMDGELVAKNGTQALIDETTAQAEILIKKVEIEAGQLATIAEENARKLAIHAGKDEAEAKEYMDAAAKVVFSDAAAVIEKFRALEQQIQTHEATWLESIRIRSTGDAQIIHDTIDTAAHTLADVGKNYSTDLITDLKWTAMEAASGQAWVEDRAKAYMINGWNYAASWVNTAETIASSTEQKAMEMYNAWRQAQPAQSQAQAN